MQIGQKTLTSHYMNIADGIARADIDQSAREAVANSVADTLEADRQMPGFKRPLFTLLASDPLVKCAGHHDVPCPEQREIRVMMHNSHDPDGRSAMWSDTPPVMRCTSCGSHQFIAGYTEAVSG